MARIEELIPDDHPVQPHDCPLVLAPDTPLQEALSRMQEAGCDRIAVAQGDPAGPLPILSREDLLQGLMRELDQTQQTVVELQRHVEGALSEHFEMVQQSVRSLATAEKDKLQTAVAQMSEGLMILDRQERVENANPAAIRLLGLEPNTGFDGLTAAVESIGVRQIIGDGAKTAQPGGEMKLRMPAGRVLEIRWNRLSDEFDTFMGHIVTLRDISEEIAAEKAKNEFIAAISHELRTPLTSIQNSVSNIMAGVTGRIRKATRKYLHVMKQDCHRLADLINDLLDLAKLEAGSLPINRRVINPASVIAEVMYRFGGEFVAGIRFQVACEEQISPVYADPHRIGQVLQNLISNAVKFTPAGGQITIHSFDREDHVVVAVEDTGVGIAADLQKRVFNKFYQVDRQAGPGYKGGGLGLAICSGIIAAHGGRIWVESEPGQGSRFYFSLPKADPHITLANHMKFLARRSGRDGSSFALVVVSTELPDNPAGSMATVTHRIMTELLIESEHFLSEPDDLSLQTGQGEAAFVVFLTRPARLDQVRKKIEKIVSDGVRKYCGDAAILPMVGVGVFPGDSCDVTELQRLARKQALRV